MSTNSPLLNLRDAAVFLLQWRDERRMSDTALFVHTAIRLVRASDDEPEAVAS